MNYVVGSGPAGISCAQGLLDRGAEVTLIDSGLTLEPATTIKVEALAGSDAQSWNTPHTAFLKENVGGGASGIRLKLAYGSDFPYRRVPGATSFICDGADTKPSYAQGGLSTVWGAAVLPYRQQDLDGWPITADDLAPAYRAVLKWMPLSARRDDLEELFPLYSDTYSPLPLSRQAISLLDSLERRKTQLKSQGVRFGMARLAVRGRAQENSPGCVACGLCMYGCPHRLIYSSDATLQTLKTHPNFTYLNGLTVRTVKEYAKAVRINAINQTGKAVEIDADRVFLGAGVLQTTGILLRSLEQYDRPVTLKDSQYFLLPLLRFKGTQRVSTERLHTLAQIFVEILDPKISPYTIHLQTYTYNELFRDPLVAALKQARHVFPQEAFLGRLLLFQGYLHSLHSPQISMTLSRNGDDDEVKLVGIPNEDTRKTLGKLVRKLSGLARSTGLFPLFPMLQPGKPGRGFHSGGTFPMSAKPGPNQTDVFGRVNGLSRVHAIDSTVFPSVPAATITFTVMANAYRIGSLFPEYAQ